MTKQIAQKITPNLWFDGDAKEAVDFYLSVFPGSRKIFTYYYPEEGLADFQKGLAGKELTIDFELFDQKLLLGKVDGGRRGGKCVRLAEG